VLSREELFEENQRLKAELQERNMRMVQLEYQLDYLRKKLFGSGKSEKLDANQRELLLGLIESVEKQLEEATETTPQPRKKRTTGASRQERYEDLPVKETVEIVPDEVLANPELYERTGAVEETFEVDYTLPEFFRRRIVRPKFRRKDDRTEPLVVAPAKPRVVEGLASANLLALIIIAKFLDHLPLHRQAKIYKRHGCEFAPTSMVRWVEKAAQWLKPIYDHMAWELLQGNYLQTDAYAPYLAFAKAHQEITLLGCMAHARRYFTQAHQYNRRECDLVLRLMARLYAVEKEIRSANPALEPEQIVAIRQAKATNTLKRLKRVFQIIQARMTPQQPVRKAADYAMANWEALCQYTSHAEAQIDNNQIENAIRPTAVGKKNWLFIGHPNAGDRATIIYSILISCERLGVDPKEYLTMVFEQPTAELNRAQLAELTPRAFAQSKVRRPAAA